MAVEGEDGEGQEEVQLVIVYIRGRRNGTLAELSQPSQEPDCMRLFMTVVGSQRAHPPKASRLS